MLKVKSDDLGEVFLIVTGWISPKFGIVLWLVFNNNRMFFKIIVYADFWKINTSPKSYY